MDHPLFGTVTTTDQQIMQKLTTDELYEIIQIEEGKSELVKQWKELESRKLTILEAARSRKGAGNE